MYLLCYTNNECDQQMKVDSIKPQYNGGWTRTASIAQGVEKTAMQTRSTLPYANRIGGVGCGRWVAIGARCELSTEQVTTLIVCSYSFDIDEEGAAAHNRAERYINNSFIGPLLLQ